VRFLFPPKLGKSKNKRVNENLSFCLKPVQFEVYFFLYKTNALCIIALAVINLLFNILQSLQAGTKSTRPCRFASFDSIGCNLFIFRGQCLYFSNNHTMHIKSDMHNSIAMFPLKPFPWRDSNPGIPFLRRMRCPLRHDAGHI
jgi:hypothetical protein